MISIFFMGVSNRGYLQSSVRDRGRKSSNQLVKSFDWRAPFVTWRAVAMLRKPARFAQTVAVTAINRHGIWTVGDGFSWLSARTQSESAPYPDHSPDDLDGNAASNL
jgi:hypothetical protein